MKIIYFTNVPAPYTVDFLNELSIKNDITVLFDGKNDDKRNDGWYKKDNHHFRSIYLKRNGFKQILSILNDKFDIYINGMYASYNGALFSYILNIKKKKFFISADGGIIDEKDTLISIFLKRHYLKKSDYYISSGNVTNKYLVHYGADINKIFNVHFSSLKSNDILNNPVGYDKKLRLRQDYGYNYRRLFISVGSFIERKGYDLFIEAIKNLELEDTAFIIIGGGSEKSKLDSMIKKYNIKNVFLLDYHNKNELSTYYKMADVFFFPSRQDIWGLVINEAMAKGLPIISSDKVNAAVELLDEEHLYNPYDLEKLCNLIDKMTNLSNNDLYSIGLTNLKRIKPYSIENMAKEHEYIFEKVLKHE